MRKRSLAIATVFVLIGLTVPAMAGTSQAAVTTWATTATGAEPTAAFTALGPLSSSQALPITVDLALRNRAVLDQDIASGVVLTPAQFNAQFAPAAASASQVAAYLRQFGLTGIAVNANNTLVTASATVAQAQSAFNTRLQSFKVGAKMMFANTAAAEVPASLGGVVQAVLGLNNVAAMQPAPLPASSASSCLISGIGYPCTYNPQGFWKAYDASSASTGSATPIAIFAEGNLTQVVKDLRQEETANALPQVPVTVVPTGPASTDTSGADEWDLDTQYSTGMADTVSQLYIYDAPSLSDADTTTEFEAFVQMDKAKAASASFGECEYQAKQDGSLAADDQIFAEAAVQGQTVFASAGDTGGFCPLPVSENGVPAGFPDVNYPASSKYVVAVGGTTLITNTSGGYGAELAWLAGGGGISIFESYPTWQASDGVTGLVASTVCGLHLLNINCGRTVPDIAMDADPESGANVYVSGTPEGVGGTSLSSPLALGVWARLETADHNGLTFASPILYKRLGSAAFHDVILGDTGPYPATPGYDLATGIGTFDVAKAQGIIG